MHRAAVIPSKSISVKHRGIRTRHCSHPSALPLHLSNHTATRRHFSVAYSRRGVSSPRIDRPPRTHTYECRTSRVARRGKRNATALLDTSRSFDHPIRRRWRRRTRRDICRPRCALPALVDFSGCARERLKGEERRRVPFMVITVIFRRSRTDIAD